MVSSLLICLLLYLPNFSLVFYEEEVFFFYEEVGVEDSSISLARADEAISVNPIPDSAKESIEDVSRNLQSGVPPAGCGPSGGKS